MTAVQQADQLPDRLAAAERHAVLAGHRQRFDNTGTGVNQLFLQFIVAMHYEEGAEQQTNQQRWGQNQDHHARPQAVFGHGFPMWENCRTISTLNEPALNRQIWRNSTLRNVA
ncbi:hypothetical protein D3C78_1474220 [compost metagenome]